MGCASSGCASTAKSRRRAAEVENEAIRRLASGDNGYQRLQGQMRIHSLRSIIGDKAADFMAWEAHTEIKPLGNDVWTYEERPLDALEAKCMPSDTLAYKMTATDGGVVHVCLVAPFGMGVGGVGGGGTTGWGAPEEAAGGQQAGAPHPLTPVTPFTSVGSLSFGCTGGAGETEVAANAPTPNAPPIPPTPPTTTSRSPAAGPSSSAPEPLRVALFIPDGKSRNTRRGAPIGTRGRTGSYFAEFIPAFRAKGFYCLVLDGPSFPVEATDMREHAVEDPAHQVCALGSRRRDLVCLLHAFGIPSASGCVFGVAEGSGAALLATGIAAKPELFGGCHVMINCNLGEDWLGIGTLARSLAGEGYLKTLSKDKPKLLRRVLHLVCDELPTSPPADSFTEWCKSGHVPPRIVSNMKVPFTDGVIVVAAASSTADGGGGRGEDGSDDLSDAVGDLAVKTTKAKQIQEGRRQSIGSQLESKGEAIRKLASTKYKPSFTVKKLHLGHGEIKESEVPCPDRPDGQYVLVPSQEVRTDVENFIWTAVKRGRQTGVRDKDRVRALITKGEQVPPGLQKHIPAPVRQMKSKYSGR